MTAPSEAYRLAEAERQIPDWDRRGEQNENPPEIGFWSLVLEDLRTHDGDPFEPGFLAIFVHRFGNWRMSQKKVVRAPVTLLYRVAFRLVEYMCGISLWYTVKLGRRVRIWHHSGMVLHAKYIGNDVHIRQNTTFGVRRTHRNGELPIIMDGADLGAGVCVVGNVYVGRYARVAANALVLSDVPDGAVAIGNPAHIRAAHNASSGLGLPDADLRAKAADLRSVC